MSRPRILDLFCGAGGAGMGYFQAGFDVVGVDIGKQPRYPFPFIQMDCLALDIRFVRSFDAIHASPPCQAHTSMKTMHNAKDHLDLVPATRLLLNMSELPYVIENVVGAPLINPITLCGTMFGLGVEDAELRRHRLFESSFPMMAPQCQHGSGDTIGIYGGHVRNRRRRPDSSSRGVADFSIEQGKAAIGIDWMILSELSQAVPPAFTKFIGTQLLTSLQQEKAA